MAEQPFCRLTVLAPRRRVDVALPSDVPVAELVPMVLELVGEPGTASPPRPWRLSGVVGGPLPAAATLDDLGVLDGELLRLGPATPAPAPPVFDDPVDAVATGAAARPRAHRFETAVVLAAAAAAAVLLGAAGPGSVPSTLLAGAGAVVAVGSATRLARGTDPAVAPTIACGTALAGVALAAAAGWTAVPGAPGPMPFLAAAVAAGIAATAAQLLLRTVAPTLVAAGAVAVVGVLAVVAVQLGVPPVVAATGAAALAVVAAPLLPRAAIRLAGLPRPVVAADGAELTADDPALPPAELAERAELARGYVIGLVGAAATIATAGALVAAAADGWAGPAFAGVTAAVLLLRSRGYADIASARTTLAAGVVTGVGLVAALAGPGSPPRLVACAVLLVGAGAGVVALDATARGLRREVSPVLRRTVDLVEGVLVASAAPLAFAAMDLFQLVRRW
ncbi:MAG: type VII secretion integral membrane protein EccD [Pseudonocardia sp.]|nr:type VII secretion integral membrane protein EccD [Pseudonocardia sp.]